MYDKNYGFCVEDNEPPSRPDRLFVAVLIANLVGILALFIMALWMMLAQQTQNICY